jgi:hypothetical protein
MTFSEDMLIRRSQSQSLCSYAFTLSRPSKKDVHNWSLTAVFSFLSRNFFRFFFSSAQHSMVMHGVITESFHWPFFSITKKALLSVMWVRNPNQKSSASQWLNGSHHPPLAQTPFAALRSSREAGELSWVDFTMIVSLKFSTMPSLLVQRPGLGVGLSGQWKCTSVLS